MPEIDLAARGIRICSGDSVLDINCDTGALCLILAKLHPRAKFYLYDDNVAKLETAKKNVQANYLIDNLCVIDYDFLQLNLFDKKLNVIIFRPGQFVSACLFEKHIKQAIQLLLPEGRLYVVTHKKWGAKRQQKTLSSLFNGAEIVVRGRGGYRIIEAVGPRDVVDMKIVRPKISFEIFGRLFEVTTDYGLFSKDDLDKGTRFLLLSVVNSIHHSERLLDVGCGWGAIGLVAAKINQSLRVSMVDVSQRAIMAVETNISQLGLTNRVAAYLGIEAVQSNDFDLVLSNPPFHSKRDELVHLFKRVRAKMKKGARIYLVVEKTYLGKFRLILQEVFRSVRLVKQDTEIGFYILESKK